MGEWTTVPGELHFHDYGFDEYTPEVITLEAAHEHRADSKALDWEDTHRKWTDQAWQLDFAALDNAMEHFLARGYSVTTAVSDLSIFPSDYDAPFLEVQLPSSHHPMSTVTRTTMNRLISVRSRSIRYVKG